MPAAPAETASGTGRCGSDSCFTKSPVDFSRSAEECGKLTECSIVAPFPVPVVSNYPATRTRNMPG
jgi:hypothetical protein